MEEGQREGWNKKYRQGRKGGRNRRKSQRDG